MPKFIPPLRLLPSALCLLPAVPRLLPAALCLLASAPTQADFFGTGENRFEIPFVEIGALGNPADTTGNPNPAGRVDRLYQIGKYELPEEAITKANAASGLTGNPLNLTMSVTRGPQKPATGLRWTDVARFVNWLNSQVGAAPAYKFDSTGAFQLWTPADPGYDPTNRFRNLRAAYFLPSTDEWYKAAYYDAVQGVYFDFATGSDTPPTPVASGTDPNTAVYNQPGGPADVTLAGGASHFGAVGMSGNVWEWEETAFDLINSSATETRGVRGGSFGEVVPQSLSNSPRGPHDVVSRPDNVGFRVARVPEPASVGIIMLISLSTLGCSRR